MRTFNVIFGIELRKLMRRKFLALFLLFSMLSLYFVQMGVYKYKEVIENRDKFLRLEEMKVGQYINYAQYGVYGFRVMFIPSPLSVLFANSTVISELTSNVDTGERVNIYNSFIGRTLFAEKTGGFNDFSGIMLLLGSLLVLYYGYDAVIHKDYFRYMAGVVPIKKLFAITVLCRCLLIVLYFLFNGALALLLMKINGLELSGDWGNLGFYLGLLVMLMVFFFFMGTAAGALPSRFIGFVTLFLAWFVFVFLVPGIVNNITYRNANNLIPLYQLEIEKLKTMMDFEKRAIKEGGVLKDPHSESERKIIESFWENEFKKLQQLEKKLEKDMARNISSFQSLSFHFPSTFYLAAANEISSKGYENFIHFYSYIQDLKKQFVRFYSQKRYYSNYSSVESFIKGEENLFNAASQVPGNFQYGLILTLLYIVILIYVSYILFKRSLRV